MHSPDHLRYLEVLEKPPYFPTLESAHYTPGIPLSNEAIEAWGIRKPNGDLLTAAGIKKATGIEKRHVAQPHETTLSMGHFAIEQLDNPDAATWLIVTNSHPTGINHAWAIQNSYMLPLEYALDIHAACSGGPYALTIMKDNESFFMDKTGILLATEKYSHTVEDLRNGGIQNDLSLAQTLFTDGALAVEFTYGKDLTVVHYKNQVLPAEVAHAIQMPVDPTLMRHPYVSPLDIQQSPTNKFRQDGQLVLTTVERNVPPLITATLEEAALQPEDIALIIPHQGSAPVINRIKRRMPEYEGKIMEDYHDGNFSSGSTLKALMRALSEKRVKAGDTIVLAGFGAGLFASVVVLKLGTS